MLLKSKCFLIFTLPYQKYHSGRILPFFFSFFFFPIRSGNVAWNLDYFTLFHSHCLRGNMTRLSISWNTVCVEYCLSLFFVFIFLWPCWGEVKMGQTSWSLYVVAVVWNKLQNLVLMIQLQNSLIAYTWFCKYSLKCNFM